MTYSITFHGLSFLLRSKNIDSWDLTSEAILRSSEAVSENVIKWFKLDFAITLVSKMYKNKTQWPQTRLDLRGWYGGCWGWVQKMTALWSKRMNFIMAAFHWPHIVQFEAAWPQITWIYRHFRGCRGCIKELKSKLINQAQISTTQDPKNHWSLYTISLDHEKLLVWNVSKRVRWPCRSEQFW